MRHSRKSLKFWQCRKKWIGDSDSKLQDQIGFIVSWKLWLNLCSLRWLKPERNLVRSLIPRLSETLHKLLGEGLINFSNEFLKTWYDTDLRIFGLILFLCCVQKERVCKIFYSATHIKKIVAGFSLIGLINCWNIVSYNDSLVTYSQQFYKIDKVSLTIFFNLNIQSPVPGAIFPLMTL